MRPEETPRTTIQKSYSEFLVDKGYMFTVQDVIQGITQNSTIDILLAFTASGLKDLSFKEVSFGLTSGKVIGRFFQIGDWDDTDSTLLAVGNRNEKKAAENVAQTVFRYKTDGATTPGAGSGTRYLIGGSSSPASSAFSASLDEFPNTINTGGRRLLRFVHDGNAPFDFSIRLIFAEIPN